jgi:hypothetical protein
MDAVSSLYSSLYLPLFYFCNIASVMSSTVGAVGVARFSSVLMKFQYQEHVQSSLFCSVSAT